MQERRSSYNVTRDVVVVNDDCPQRKEARRDANRCGCRGKRLWSRVASMLVGEKAEEEQIVVSYIYARTFPADSAPLLLPCSSSIAASKAATGQILSAALQILLGTLQTLTMSWSCRHTV